MVIGLMQDELGRKLLAKFATLQRKTRSYLINQKKKSTIKLKLKCARLDTLFRNNPTLK